MKISETWLRTYVNPALSTEELVAQITMAGLEVDAVEPVAAEFSGVVVGEVVEMEKHPDADKLNVCRVNVGETELLQIVCGAANVRVGLKIPAALCGAILPGDFKIKQSKLRGVESFGMLCSAKELGLVAEAEGLMELPADAPIGTDIRAYLQLNDNSIEVDLTPNRADCLSVEGVAREVAVLNKMPLNISAFEPVVITHSEKLTVTVAASKACPRYLARVISGVNNQAEIPLWMVERLRRSGLRSLSPLVDVTNYVLLELGQPLHVFDAAKLSGGITVRYAINGETLELLNAQTIMFDEKCLVIADDESALAFAGVMGGSYSAVNKNTQSVFLECAFFTPLSIAGKARQFGLHTDSSHRFERGVDFELQNRAIERATQLILEICGGQAGEITDVTTVSELPKREPICFRETNLNKILGMPFASENVCGILERLGMKVVTQTDGWLVTPPSFRFDIAIEADLIEEIARIHGYNNLPNNQILVRSSLNEATETVLDLDRVKDLLVDYGYQEAITYSFVDENLQKTIAPSAEFIRLKNPISADLAVMRTTLWGGLLTAALHNTNRQQTRVRLFESGLRFVQKDGETLQEKMIAGLALGNAWKEQWGEQERALDFFDVKADVEAMFALTGCNVQFVADLNETLHSGQSAKILNENNEVVGWLGMLHPTLEQQLGFETPVFLFELAQDLLLQKRSASFKALSKFPSVRRDLALLVKEETTADDIIAAIQSCVEPLLQEAVIFDVYRGKGVDDGFKSVALSLVLQNQAQTLTDVEIDAIVNTFLKTLTVKTGAKLRD
ncbi:MAG: phenylalanine--tRNA ligase subunit beta [Methylococcaceae bacterium]|nr:phenylalanine--tRNA ligase subunit beta [Methylococcaceae bacterium]